jgi:hypothetical protein
MAPIRRPDPNERLRKVNLLWHSRFHLAGLTACAALLLGAVPARAGSYSVYPVSGSGTMTYTGASGSSTTPLTSSFCSGNAGSGSFSFTYTENWHYSWEPSSDEDEYGNSEKDEPVDQAYELTGSVQFDMMSTSGAMDGPGSASGSATIGGNTATANLSVAQGGAVLSESGDNVPRTLTVARTLSGWAGDFTLTYSGSVSTSASGAVDATITLNGPMGGQATTYWIYVTGPRSGSSFQGGFNLANPFISIKSVEITGVWKNPGWDPEATWRIHLEGVPNPLFDIDPNIPVSQPDSNHWDSWSGTFPFYTEFMADKNHHVTGWLQYKNPDEIWVSDMEPPMCHSSTNFTVKY